MTVKGKQELLGELRARIASLEAGDSPFAGNDAAPLGENRNSRVCESLSHMDTGYSRAMDESDSQNENTEGEHRGSGENRFGRSNGKSAYAKILRLSSVRERSSSSLRTRLASEGYDECEIEEALARAQRCGVVDDARFAESLCRSRIAAGRGLSGIRIELEKHGIDPNAVPCAWGGDESEEVERACALLRKKPPTAKNKRDAAYRKLVQRGFGSPVAAAAARTWVAEIEGEEL